MTATTSAASKNFFGKRFVTDLLENKKVLIINALLELLGLPVVSILAIVACYIDKLEEQDTNFYVDLFVIIVPFICVAVGAIVLSILLGFVVALFHFNYLYRKSIVDMHYSLPLSNTQRFFADYLSGLAIYIVPVIIAVILSFIILGIGGVFVDMSEFWEVMPYIVKAGTVVIVGMMMIYTISIFSIVFCGSTFEAIFSILAVNTLIPATIGCVWLAIVTTSSYGMVGESIFYSPVFTATSPFGATVFFFLYLFEGVDQSMNDIGSYYDSMYIRWMIVAVVMTALYLVASFLLYKLRKAESVSKPYVYKAFFYAVGAASVFCIMSLLIASSINIISAAISGIIICGVGWFIMEVIARRGFKRFWTAPLGFAAVVCGVFLVCGICKVTDGFGAPRHVPASISVESVSINVNDNSILPYEVSEVSFRDKDVIKAVTAFNKDAVNRHFHFDDYEYTSIGRIDSEYDRYDHQSVEITYQTIYGSTVKRDYDVMSFMLSDVAEAILCSDEYAEMAADEIAVAAVNATNSGQYIGKYSAVKSAKKGGRLEITNKLGQSEGSVSLGYDSLVKLHDAYMKDIKSMTPEQLRDGNVCCMFGQYWVLDSFDNTLDFLAERDLSVGSIEKSDIYHGGYNSGDDDIWLADNVDLINSPRFYSQPKSFFGKSNEGRYSRYYYDGYTNNNDDDRYSEIDAITSAFPNESGRGYYSSDYVSSEVRLDDTLLILINKATPIIINEKPIAIIHYKNTSTLYIRDTVENRELLEKYYHDN